ncbi:UNVERIFIED_CONTAM: hypothetical protein FKN15_034302 [Acipenser sinensis]
MACTRVTFQVRGTTSPDDHECVDSGWLTFQTEIRLRLHYSEKPPVSISKKKFKKSRFRVKLTLEGCEDDDDDDEEKLSPSSWHKMATTLGISLIGNGDYKSRHSQPDFGYALDPNLWTEYSIHTMDPDNLELTFEFFEEDLSETVVQGDTVPGHVGTACLLSSTFVDTGKNTGFVILPIMARNSRQTIGKGAAFVEFDVHLSKDSVPIVYHDLTCCISMKKKSDNDSLELFEIPVKELTFDQLQLLKILQAVPEHVGFNIEIKWLCQLKCVLQNAGKRRIVFSSFNADICTMVRQKQNKYPILFLTQGFSEVYPELIDLRSRTTSIAMSFAQSEDILGINVHTEDLLRNLDYIKEVKSKGLVLFCWGDDNNDHENRRKLKEFGVDGLVYDRICDAQPEQPNIFKMEQLEGLKDSIPEETLKSCATSSICLTCSSVCSCKQETGSTESDSGLSNASF